MNLSPHFTFDELTRTGQTALQATNRQEAQACMGALTALATTILEPIRAKFGAVKIASAIDWLLDPEQAWVTAQVIGSPSSGTPRRVSSSAALGPSRDSPMPTPWATRKSLAS